MNCLRMVFILFLFAFKIHAMEPVASPIFLVPKEIMGQILGYLYEPEKKCSATSFIRFLRTSKKFYNSEELAGILMAQMRAKHLRVGIENRWIDSVLDLGTPAATEVMKKHLKAHPDYWPQVHRRYTSMSLFGKATTREALMLKTIGADINAPINERGQSKFLAAVPYYPQLFYLKNLLNSGADINSCDADGDNSLIMLIRRMADVDLLPIAHFLIDEGINLNHCTKAGRSAARSAQLNGKCRVQKAIEDAGGRNIG